MGSSVTVTLVSAASTRPSNPRGRRVWSHECARRPATERLPCVPVGELDLRLGLIAQVKHEAERELGDLVWNLQRVPIREHHHTDTVVWRQHHLTGDPGHVAVVADERPPLPSPDPEAESVALRQIGVVLCPKRHRRLQELGTQQGTWADGPAGEHHLAEPSEVDDIGGQSAHRSGDEPQAGDGPRTDAWREDLSIVGRHTGAVTLRGEL